MEKSLNTIVRDIGVFSGVVWPKYALRDYQLEPARAIVDSVINGKGMQFALVFSRQSGKDETLAQVIAYLLTLYQLRGGTCVLATPTFAPQATTSMHRAVTRLQSSPLTQRKTKTREGYILSVGKSEARYLSAEPSANPRGQTADLLLIANEAQDIDPAIWDARFDPMAASTDATTVYVGTVWTQQGLLSRQIKHLTKLQHEDGVQRVYRATWEKVAASLPAYGQRVQARIAQLGASHPYIKTEYMLQELDGEGGLFGPERLSQLQGQHQRCRRNEDSGLYALLLDVAGSDEAGSGPQAYDRSSKRDSAALTVVRVDHSAPGFTRYAVVDRRAWTNVPLVDLEATVADLAANTWKAAAIVVDATGIGQGIYSGLNSHFTSRSTKHRVHVQPFVFTQSSKSALGWDLIALIDSGRLKEYTRDQDNITDDYYDQMGKVTFEILPGPQKTLRWSVPTSQGHDDLVMSSALVSVLDELDLRPRVAKGH